MTQSTFFYFVLPLGLVVAAAFAAQVQGWHFARKDKRRTTKSVSLTTSGARRDAASKRERWAGARMILATLAVTIGSMKIVEYAISDNPSVELTDAALRNHAIWYWDGLLGHDGRRTYAYRPLPEDKQHTLGGIPTNQTDFEPLPPIKELTAEVPKELSPRDRIN